MLNRPVAIDTKPLQSDPPSSESLHEKEAEARRTAGVAEPTQ